MANPYFNPHSSYAYYQHAHKSVTSISCPVLNDCTQESGVAFGLKVQQAVPNKQLNTLILDGEQFHNPSNNSFFNQVQERVITHQEPDQTEPLDLSVKQTEPLDLSVKQTEPLDLSVKPNAQQTDESAQFNTGQLELRIEKVWSMASEASSQTHSNHAPFTSTLNDTAENSSLDVGQSTPQISSVVDKDLHQPLQIPNQYCIVTFSKPESPIASDELRYMELNAHTVSHSLLQWGSCRETYVKFSQLSSCPVAIVGPQQEAQMEAECVSPLLTSSKGKAAQAKYEQSPAGKAAKARAQAKYEQSPAGKAARARVQAKYEQSPARKAAKAIQSARFYAYKTELAKSGNEEIAKQKGEEAAERKRLSLQNKSVDQIPPPAFQSSS